MKKLGKFIIVLLTFILIMTTTIKALALDTGDEKKISISAERKKWENDKVVYLTFDDGPTENTLKILDILKNEGVHGTFFVIGELVEQNPEILKKAAEEGHEICIHTYSHDNNIYTSKGKYIKDYEKAYEIVKATLNREPSKFMRMPGGSSTTIGRREVVKAIRDELTAEGLYYVDWNISLEDAIHQNTPVNTLLSTFRKELKKSYIDPYTAIVLMHDGNSNTTTPRALPTVIKYFKDNGYTFKTFGEVSEGDFERLINQRHINKFNQEKCKYSKDSEGQITPAM